MKFKDLLKWIADGSKDWEKGVQLYNQFVSNGHLKRRFERLGPIEFNRGLLREELISLARTLETSFAKKQHPKSSKLKPGNVQVHQQTKTVTAPAVIIPPDNGSETAEQELTVDLASLPELLRKLHFKKGQLFNEASKLHKQLDSAPQHERAAMVETIVENMRENQAIWKELEHFRSKGKIKGNHPELQQRTKVKELKDSPLDVLQRTLTNRRSNLSRYKKLIADSPGHEIKNDRRRKKIEEWAIEIKAIESILKSHAV